MSILKRQVYSSPSFVSLFSFMKDYSSVLFSSKIYTLLKRSPLKWKVLRIFECSGQNLLNSLCQFLNDASILHQILYSSSVSWKITPLYFFSSNNIYFAHKEPIRVKIFETFERSGQNLSNSLRQFWNDESIPLQILYPSSVSWKITPLYFFSLNNIYFAQKEHIKMKIFETFKCSGQNSLSSSCQFWNDKSVSLQILHHSSFSWLITPLWTLSSYFSYFRLKDPIKIPILKFSIALVKICRIPVMFQTTSRFFFKFCITHQCHETPLYFFRSNIILCTFFIVIILNFFVCSYCCKLFVINYFT